MGAPGSHKMVLDFSHIILGFEGMHAAVERAESLVSYDGFHGYGGSCFLEMIR